MTKILYIGFGGFIGAVLRYIVTISIQYLTHGIHFPYGTFIVNMVGCFFIGYVSQLFETHLTVSPEIRLFLLVGILGSFTTYSTFSNDTITLFNNDEILSACINLFGHIFLGLMGVILGRYFVTVSVRVLKPLIGG